MPTSATGANRQARAPRGFTLIEILVVLVIIGVLGVTAVDRLNFGGNNDPQRDEARRLHVMLQLASDEALLTSQTLGLLVTTDSYQFLRRSQDAKGDWIWSEFDADGKLSGNRFDEESPLFLDMELEAQLLALKTARELEASEQPLVPQLWFLPDGELLPQYRLTVSAERVDREYRIESTSSEPVTLDVISR